MLKNKRLLIDNDCPMCGFYGQCFKKLKLINEDTVYPYQTAHADITQHIDMDKARNAIALYGEDKTVYGIDAFIEILAHNSKLLRRVLTFPLIYYPLLFIYFIISYNRKLIYPVATTGNISCIPDVNVYYRWIYIGLVAIVTGIILNIFSFRVMVGLALQHTPYIEWIMCFGQVAWQAVAIQYIHKSKTLDYLGNMSTVSLMGGIFIALLLFIGNTVTLSSFMYLGAFGCVVTFMLYEHVRRCKLLGLPLAMTVSWVVYRLVFLAIIINTIINFL